MYWNFDREMQIKEKYRILNDLGEGGSAHVYKVRDEHIGREYAMKVMNKKGNHDIYREVQMLQKLEHRGLPSLHDVIETQDKMYIVMELAKGRTLNEYVRMKGKLTIKESIEIGKRICEIISYLHKQSLPVIHGDLKPQNIMIGEMGDVELLDFGSAFRQYEAAEVIYGTPGYAAYEVQEGKLFTQSDVYSFGRVLEFMLTGRTANLIPILHKRKNLRAYGVPKKICDIVCKCTKERPEERYQSGQEVLEALDKVKRPTTHLPGKALLYFSVGVRMLGAGVLGLCLYDYKMQEFTFLHFLFLLGCTLLIISFIIEKVAEKLYKTAILECECSIFISQGQKRIKTTL